MFIAQFAEALQIAVARDVDSAFGLNRLYQNRAGFLVDSGFGCRQIIKRHVGEAFQHRFKPDVVFRLRRGGDGCHRSPVERILHRDDFVGIRSAAVFGELARQFNGCFVRLRAAVAEEHLIHVGILH